MISDKCATSIALAVCATLALLSSTVSATEQPYFTSPEEATQALIEAAEADDSDAILLLLGPQGHAIRSSDPVADALERKGFAEAARQATSVHPDGDDYATIAVGEDDWPFPVPLVKDPDGWRFDTEAGIEELLDRRIGRNELHTIETARAFVAAQRAYASQDRNGDGLPEFAQALMSTEGERNGLYWPTTGDEPESPMDRLVAEAIDDGYQPGHKEEPTPYHGYYYRALTAQGESAPEGAKRYIVDGRMTEGFALLAYPADYGNSGIMSFLINQSGTLYQKDLGEDTGSLAAAVTAYDPDQSWEPITD